MEEFNLQTDQHILADDHPKTRIKFARKHNMRVEDIPYFKLPGYNVNELKIKLNDTIDAGFKRIYDAWKKKS